MPAATVSIMSYIILEEKQDIRGLAISLENNGILPGKIPILGIVYNILRGVIQHEIVVDSWPEFTSIVLRPPQKQIEPDIRDYHIYTTNIEKCIELIRKTEVIPWIAGIELEAISPELTPHVESIASSHGLLSTCHPCHLITHNVSQDTTVNRKPPPPGFYMDTCRPSDAKIINDTWKFQRGEETEKKIRRVIQHLPSVCLRSSSGQAVAWGLMEFTGEMGISYTLPEYRGKGFQNIGASELILKCRSIQPNLMPFGYIELDNAVSARNANRLPTKTDRQDVVSFIHLTAKTSAKL